MAIAVNDIIDTFSVLRPDLRVDTVDVTPGLYANLDSDYSGFKDHALIASYEFSEDWPTWERHPAGDEVVMLLSGEATLILKTASGEKQVVLDNAGSYIIVPRNTWHTARVAKSARMLFITPGEGTENVENPAD